jgi:hypothetical protein
MQALCGNRHTPPAPVERLPEPIHAPIHAPAAWVREAVAVPCHPRGMDDIADVLLLRAVLAWCEECRGQQLLVPADDEAGGLCCTVCDAAVFVVPMPEGAVPLRRTA